MNPKVFVSSTILDFEDLRGAIKYYLEEFGFEVQMSEYPTFKVDPNYSAQGTCFKNIGDCQYFILLIGYRRGSWFEQDKVSVTHKEYRVAKELIEKGHPLKIITFIRKSIWLFREDRKALSKHFKKIADELLSFGTNVVDDPQYIFDFVSEIQSGINKPDTDNPVNDWIFDFDTFRDIAEALTITFNMSQNIKDKKLITLLKQELLNNKNKIILEPDDLKIFSTIDHLFNDLKETEPINILEFYRRCYDNRLPNADSGKKPAGYKPIKIPNKYYQKLFFYSAVSVAMLQLTDLRTTIIDRVLNEGTFLKFNPIIDNFDNHIIIRALEELRELINSLKSTLEDDSFNDLKLDLYKPEINDEYFELSSDSAVTLFLLGQHSQIVKLIDKINHFLVNDEIEPLINHFDKKKST